MYSRKSVGAMFSVVALSFFDPRIGLLLRGPKIGYYNKISTIAHKIWTDNEPARDDNGGYDSDSDIVTRRDFSPHQ